MTAVSAERSFSVVVPSVLRPTLRQAMVASFVPAVLLLAVGVAIGGNPGSLLLGAGIGSIGLGALHRRTGLDLEPDAVTVRGIASTAVVGWADIVDITIAERGGRKSLQIETAARYYRPSAPFTSRILPDADFEAKAHGFIEQWREHRGGPSRHSR